LFLAAALTDWFLQNRFVSEILGWSGIMCLQFCVVCGVRYARVNDASQTNSSVTG
jgi:hypothetical protein